MSGFARLTSTFDIQIINTEALTQNQTLTTEMIPREFNAQYVMVMVQAKGAGVNPKNVNIWRVNDLGAGPVVEEMDNTALNVTPVGVGLGAIINPTRRRDFQTNYQFRAQVAGTGATDTTQLNYILVGGPLDGGLPLTVTVT